jgi:NitT/TauT family transport system substrate-binding protein
MPEKQVVKIGHLRITDHLALGITLDKLETGQEQFKYFDLQTKAYGGWNPLAMDLRGGDLDGAFILAPIAMELFYSKKNIKNVLQAHKSGSIIVANKRANINTLQDFKGKAVLIPHYLSVHHLLFDRLLRENGLEVGPGKDVICDVVSPSEIPEIMEWDEKGKVGGFIVAEPFGSQVIKAGYGTEFKLSKDIWPNHPCCILVLKDDVVAKNPDGVMELVNSLVQSGQYITNHKEGASEIGARFLKQDVDVVRRVLSEPPDRVTFNEMFPVLQDYEYIQTYMTETIQAMSAKIDIEKFVDTRFAKEAGAK